MGEGGWNLRDWIAVRWVIHTVALIADITEAAAALSYCAALKPPLTPRKRWVWGLRADALEPPHWPANASWQKHAPLWRKALKLASRPAVRPWFCDRMPRHWGARNLKADARRMDAAVAAGRWVDAGCRGTLNEYYALAGRERS